MQYYSKRAFLTFLAAAFASPAFAGPKPYWSTRKTGFVADGADVVAYHGLNENARAVMGKNEFAVRWKEGIWVFANAQNMAAFKSNPSKFAPEFGGYCALSVAYGGTSRGDKDAWHIHKGRLYLNGSKNVRRKWLRNKLQFIQWAQSQWPGVLSA